MAAAESPNPDGSRPGRPISVGRRLSRSGYRQTSALAVRRRREPPRAQHSASGRTNGVWAVPGHLGWTMLMNVELSDIH